MELDRVSVSRFHVSEDGVINIEPVAGNLDPADALDVIDDSVLDGFGFGAGIVIAFEIERTPENR